MIKGRDNSEGISLRTIHTWQIIGAVIVSALLFYSTFHLTESFRRLTENAEKQIELRNAATELMEASDYLTEKVQRFSVQGDIRFVYDYFNEAFEANHREEAISRVTAGTDNKEALAKLQAAMEKSLELMNREYYAMKLVIEAGQFTDYPDVLKSVELSEEDRALSSDEKMRRAAVMVHDDDYYRQKEEIRQNMKASLSELEEMVYDADASALISLSDEMMFLRVIIVIQIFAVFLMVWLTSRLGITPVLDAVDRIKEDSPLQEVGANELRYLARAYNKMYEVYRSSLERLNFKASHDELTGAYNRSGYDLLLSSIDLNKTCMLLFDVDNFKDINDTYGHETGDKVLVNLVRILKKNFRSDDYVCRIGGDEFVVFMVHAAELQRDLIAQKIDDINRELEKSEDGLPAISVSVGIVHGADAANAENLFEKTDEAMYQSKRSGKHTYTFYSR